MDCLIYYSNNSKKFYAPWCGTCKQLAPQFDKVAVILNGFVKVAAVDATNSEHLSQKHEIDRFPTLKLFGGNKTLPTDYQGHRNIKSIVDSAVMHMYSLVKARVSLINSHGVEHVRASIKPENEDEWSSQQCGYGDSDDGYAYY